ncbi:MAG: glycosyltransferase family 39 protein [Phycisphaerae bacterium]|nr:glycosyltransferase family 39 protein [Phycisphaerae bacterium]
MLVAVFALAVAFRLVYAIEIGRSPIPDLWRDTETDIYFFAAWAGVIADGDWLTDQALHPYFSWQRMIAPLEQWNAWYGGKAFHQAPLYAYLLAVVFKVFGQGMWLLYALQALGSSLTALLLASIGRRLFNPIVGLLAGILTAVYGPLLFYDFVGLRASLTTLALAGAIWCLVWAWPALREPAALRPGRFLLVGAVAGLGCLLRSNATVLPVLVIAALVLFGWRERRRMVAACLALVAGFAVCLVPLVARNVVVGAPALSIEAVGPSTFYLANASGAPGTGWGMLGGFAEAMRRTDGRFGPLIGEALASYDSFTGPVGLLLAKLSATAHYFERTNNANPYYAERFSRLLRWGTVPYWVVLALAVAGLVATWSDRRSLIWLYVAVLAPLLTIVLVYQTARFRLPMLVGLIPLAAAAIECLIARRGQVVPIVVMIVVAGVFVRWPRDNDPPKVRPRDYQSGANVLVAAGRMAAGLAEAREAVNRSPDDPLSRLTLIRALARSGLRDEAIKTCEQAVRDFPDHGPLRVQKGDLYLDQGRAARAIEVYRSMLGTNAAHVPAILGLSRAMAAPGPSRNLNRAAALARRAVELAPNDGEAYEVYARSLVAAGLSAEGVDVLDRGLTHVARTDPRYGELARLRSETK